MAVDIEKDYRLETRAGGSSASWSWSLQQADIRWLASDIRLIEERILLPWEGLVDCCLSWGLFGQSKDLESTIQLQL